MGLFGGQFSNVVEWKEYRDDIVFWKWNHDELKKGSRLVVRQGQDAVFMFNGKVEGIFCDEGSFDIESEIIPFLSTLKGFKFGFNSGIRAEVLFINTKEFTVNWGTKNAVLIPAEGLPGGMPVRAFGVFNCKVSDHDALIEKVAGIKPQFTIEDIKGRVIAVLDQLLMKWIVRNGRDMFHLQSDALEIAGGIKEDLDMELCKIGIGITGFTISSFSYPEEIQKMAEKAASHSMIGDMSRYQQAAMADGMAKGSGGSVAGDMAGLQMGMMMGQQMVNQMQGHMENAPKQAFPSGQNAPNFCPNCGTKTNGANFCSHCGTKLT